MSFADAEWRGRPVVVCRTGYTGERGYELLPLWADAARLWDALLEAGAGLGGLPCGLGARDTLRTEMGYPLHGQDLSLDITPGPGPARAGRSAGTSPRSGAATRSLAERAAGPSRLLWGLAALDRGIPRPHMVVHGPGPGGSMGAVGEVTSGTFSPTLWPGSGRPRPGGGRGVRRRRRGSVTAVGGARGPATCRPGPRPGLSLSQRDRPPKPSLEGVDPVEQELYVRMRSGLRRGLELNGQGS